jgi:hypothetical protein
MLKLTDLHLLIQFVKNNRKQFVILLVSVIGFFLTLPSLNSGCFLDDHFFLQSNLERTGYYQRAIWDRFNFVSSAEEIKNYQEIGIFGWWVPGELKLNYFRPLSSIIYTGIFTILHATPWVMHLITIVLYTLLVYIAALVYERFSSSLLVFGVASLLFAVDDAHAYSSSWISGINTMLTVITGLSSLLMHDSWRRKKWLPGAYLSPFLLFIALMTSEGGLATVAFITAYTLFIEKNTLWVRIKTWLPCCCISVLYILFYMFSSVTAGKSSNDLNFSSGAIGFIVNMVLNSIYMIFFQIISFPPARTALAVFPGASLIVFLICIAGFLLFRNVLKENRNARFYATAMVVSTLPFSLSGSQDRLLFWTGAAWFGLLGEIIHYYRFAIVKAFVQKVIVGILIFSNLFVSLYYYVPTLGTYARFDRYAKVIEKSVFSGNTVFVNSPLEQYFLFPSAIRYLRNQIWPDHLYILYAGRKTIQVKKIDDYTIEISAPEGWVSSPSARAFLPRYYRFKSGYSVTLKKMTATVIESNSNGYPVKVRFFFPAGVDSFTWMRWGRYGPTSIVWPDDHHEVCISSDMK